MPAQSRCWGQLGGGHYGINTYCYNVWGIVNTLLYYCRRNGYALEPFGTRFRGGGLCKFPFSARNTGRTMCALLSLTVTYSLRNTQLTTLLSVAAPLRERSVH